VGIVTAGAAERIGDRNASRAGHFMFGDATTDADGYFRIIGVPASVSFEVAARPNDRFSFARPRQELQVIHTGTVRSGQKLDLGELTVRRPGGPADNSPVRQGRENK
jgi:hypothetical protein